jgi:hypothetical protein
LAEHLLKCNFHGDAAGFLIDPINDEPETGMISMSLR